MFRKPANQPGQIHSDAGQGLPQFIVNLPRDGCPFVFAHRLQACSELAQLFAGPAYRLLGAVAFGDVGRVPQDVTLAVEFDEFHGKLGVVHHAVSVPHLPIDSSHAPLPAELAHPFITLGLISPKPKLHSGPADSLLAGVPRQFSERLVDLDDPAIGYTRDGDRIGTQPEGLTKALLRRL